jgi:hypothetical protein
VDQKRFLSQLFLQQKQHNGAPTQHDTLVAATVQNGNQHINGDCFTNEPLKGLLLVSLIPTNVTHYHEAENFRILPNSIVPIPVILNFCF